MLLCLFPKEEYGHLVLPAMFDVVDDTVAVKKAILSVSFIFYHAVPN